MTIDQTRSSSGTASSTPSLDDAIREGLSQTEAKRLARKTAEAVATMHARGEVHGELSPRAILLTSRGDVTIASRAKSEPALYRMRYASPEAARREELGQASDVFALSLIVRELIEGIPARRGTGDELAMEAIDGRVSVPHGIDGEIVSLAALAASQHPENRPTASAFAAALKSESQFKGFSRQDWLIIAAALVAVALLAFLLRSSMQERERSLRQSQDARAALTGFLGGIYPELDRVEDIEPLADAGKRALQSMESMLDTERDEEDRRLLANTLLWNAEVSRVRGKNREALELYERALERADQLENKDETSRIRLEAETARGEMLLGLGNKNAAALHLKAAIEAGRKQLEARPDSRELRVLLARSLRAFADLAMSTGQGSANRARQVLSDAHSVLRHDSVQRNKNDREVLEILAELTRLEASVAARQSDKELAAQMYARHLEFTKRLVEIDPGRPLLRRNQARAGYFLGGVQRDLGRLDASVISMRDSVAAWGLLRSMQPDELKWHRQWARATRELAQLLADVGEWQEAAELHDISLGDLMKVKAAGYLDAAADLEIGIQLLDAAEGLHAAGDLKGARKRLNKARPLIGTVSPTPRVERLWASASARSQIIDAELLLSEGDWRGAEQKALAFIERIRAMSDEGDDRELRLERARALLVTSAVRAMEGEREIAKGAREQVLGIANELIREDPGFVEGHAIKARALFVLGLDAEAADVLATLDEMGYRGLDLGPVRAATAALRD